MDHNGGCHCGAIRIRLDLPKAPANYALRRCGCTFCQAHSPRMMSDPEGHMEIWAKDWSRASAYRFGTNTADFMVCSRCGVFIAVLTDTDAGLRGVVNINSLDDRAAFTQTPTAVTFEAENTESRLARRAVTWMPALLHEVQ